MQAPAASPQANHHADAGAASRSRNQDIIRRHSSSRRQDVIQAKLRKFRWSLVSLTQHFSHPSGTFLLPVFISSPLACLHSKTGGCQPPLTGRRCPVSWRNQPAGQFRMVRVLAALAASRRAVRTSMGTSFWSRLLASLAMDWPSRCPPSRNARAAGEPTGLQPSAP